MEQKTYGYILKILRPFWWPVSIMFMVAVVWAADLSLRPFVLKIILDRVSEHTGQGIAALLVGPVALYFALTLFMTLMFRAYGYFVEIKMIPVMRKRIATDAFEHLLQGSHHFYQVNFSGSLTNKINDLVNNVPDLVQLIIDRFFSHTLALLVAVLALWEVQAIFAIAMFTWAVVFVAVSLLLSRRLQRESDDWAEIGSALTGKIVDVLSNILSVRLFARRSAESKTLGAGYDDAVVAEQKLQWTYFYIWCFYGISFALMQGFCLYMLILGRENNTISVGDFALVLSINISVVNFFWEMTKDFSMYAKHVGKITQALRSTSAAYELSDAKGATELKVTRGEIVFERVRFHYRGAEPLFEDKSVTIGSGQKVGLVGYSGSGKSTFVNLILRLFEVNSGRILIDGQDIKMVTQDSLHRAIATIPQDPALFNRTLLENIRYGRVEALDEEVYNAAKRAHAHEFILAQTQGYNSVVGERGARLSGGQRQRIAIARAVLKNAPILILDEATSQLDSVIEKQIQDSLWELMQGKTTLVVAHRLSTLLQMDRILVFERGKIIQDGSHSELLKISGLYRRLWEAQVGGFLPDKAQ
jgi:ATP-binding cassette subfamily B protein